MLKFEAKDNETTRQRRDITFLVVRWRIVCTFHRRRSTFTSKMAAAARVDSMREGWRGMTGLNLERLSWIPSGGKGALLSGQIVPSSGTTRVTQPIAHVREQGRA